MYGEHYDEGLTEVDSRDIDFLEDDFPSIREIKFSLELYQLEEHQDSEFQANLDSQSTPITVEISGST